MLFLLFDGDSIKFSKMIVVNKFQYLQVIHSNIAYVNTKILKFYFIMKV